MQNANSDSVYAYNMLKFVDWFVFECYISKKDIVIKIGLEIAFGN